ncbi:putative GTP-binding protein 6 [Ctenodactylus gundi]
MWAVRAAVRPGIRLCRRARGPLPSGAALPPPPPPQPCWARALGATGRGGLGHRGGPWSGGREDGRGSCAGEEEDGEEEEEEDEEEEEEEELLRSEPLLPAGTQRVFLVHPEVKWGPGKPPLTRAEWQVAEARALVHTLDGWSVVQTAIVSTKTPNRKLIFGKGNLEQLTGKIRGCPGVTSVFLNVERMAASTQAELQAAWGAQVFDRFTLVLHIFRLHARSREARLQVALAEIPLLRHPSPGPGFPQELELRMSRWVLMSADGSSGQGPCVCSRALAGLRDDSVQLDRRARGSAFLAGSGGQPVARGQVRPCWARPPFQPSHHSVHVDTPQTVGGVTCDQAGPGLSGRPTVAAVTLLPTMGRLCPTGVGSVPRKRGPTGASSPQGRRLLLRDREARIREALERLRRKRGLLRAQRARRELPMVAVVGYTNCGKTSLIRALTGDERAQPQDQLFATLDVRVHAGRLPARLPVLYVDTVGFLSQLPHGLIQSFSATLEDVAHSDLIMHVRDVSHPEAELQKASVLSTLCGLSLPTPLLDSVLEVHNKVDLVPGYSPPEPGVVAVSALRGHGLEQLKATLETAVLRATGRQVLTLQVRLAGPQLSWLHREATVQQVDVLPEAEDALVTVVISSAAYGRFQKLFPT